MMDGIKTVFVQIRVVTQVFVDPVEMWNDAVAVVASASTSPQRFRKVAS